MSELEAGVQEALGALVEAEATLPAGPLELELDALSVPAGPGGVAEALAAAIHEVLTGERRG